MSHCENLLTIYTSCSNLVFICFVLFNFVLLTILNCRNKILYTSLHSKLDPELDPEYLDWK